MYETIRLQNSPPTLSDRIANLEAARDDAARREEWPLCNRIDGRIRELKALRYEALRPNSQPKAKGEVVPEPEWLRAERSRRYYASAKLAARRGV